MVNEIAKRAYRRRLSVRQKQNRGLYQERRCSFDILAKYEGWLWRKRLVGYVVYALKVVGASCAAPMGSVGSLVDYPISDVCPTKFSAYRWLLNNVRDYDDLSHYVY